MKRTSLHQAHIERGAQMVDFAGWHMPLRYEGIIDEHLTVRKGVGVFDVSHMGEVVIKGKGAGALLDSLLTRRVSNTQIGQASYAHILDRRGRIIDDTIVSRISELCFLLVPNASQRERVFEWIERHHDPQEHDCQLFNVSDGVSCLAVQGPESLSVLEGTIAADLNSLKKFKGTLSRAHMPGDRPPRFLADILPPNDKNGRTVYVSRTGYTGEDGFEVFIESEGVRSLWDLLLERGVKPIGLGARDTLRLEMGYLLSGTDFDGGQTTLQTGPDFVLDWDHEFIGREAMVGQKGEDYQRLVGLSMEDRGIPRHGYDILKEGRGIGHITSGTMSPCLNAGIGMGYVSPPYHREGTVLAIDIRGKKKKARVVETPFVRR